MRHKTPSVTRLRRERSAVRARENAHASARANRAAAAASAAAASAAAGAVVSSSSTTTTAPVLGNNLEHGKNTGALDPPLGQILEMAGGSGSAGPSPPSGQTGQQPVVRALFGSGGSPENPSGSTPRGSPSRAADETDRLADSETAVGGFGADETARGGSASGRTYPDGPADRDPGSGNRVVGSGSGSGKTGVQLGKIIKSPF